MDDIKKNILLKYIQLVETGEIHDLKSNELGIILRNVKIKSERRNKINKIISNR